MFSKSNKLMFLATTLAILGLGMCTDDRLDVTGDIKLQADLQEIFNKMASAGKLPQMTIIEVYNIEVSTTLLCTTIKAKLRVNYSNQRNKDVVVIIKSCLLGIGGNEITVTADGKQIGYLKESLGGILSGTISSIINYVLNVLGLGK